jgi:lipopolysaccharide/colanic/teichoic acid biosynthesis glycosyltransferase
VGRPKQGLPRVADLAIAVVSLIAVSPLLAAAAIAIRLESPGPVLYRQRRVGRDGEIFELFKLRTMRQGADPVGVGTAVTSEDPRVTRVGRLLRRFSLDELPNLFNVLRGEMRIVDRGRPSRPRSSSTRPASGVASTSAPASPAGRRSTAAPGFPGRSASSWTSGTWSTAPCGST